MNADNGLLIVISAPAGCGKDTIIEQVIRDEEGIGYSVSATTRSKRDGETDGISYFFKTRAEFEAMLAKNELLEYTEYVGNYYGTPKEPVEKALREGRDIVLKIEVEGAANIKKLYPDCVTIFLLPPSFAELRRRLEKRGTESAETITDRINKAKIELAFAKNYDYVIVNDRLEDAISKLKAVIHAEKAAVKRNMEIINRLKYE